MLLLPLALIPVDSADAQNPDQVGQWGPILDWGMIGKHMVVQPTGKVLVWATGDNARVWDPATGQFTLTPATFGDLHCGAQATLADGRTIAVGGVLSNPHDGIKVTALFDPFTNTWTQGRLMNYARWYGTATTLADGRVLASSGDDQSGGRVDLPEIYDPIANTWTVLTNASRSMSLYPYMYLLPNGKVMEAGTRTATGLLDLGAGNWSEGPTNPFGSNGYSECGAMYAPGKIMRTGGGDPAIARVSVIDMNAPSPTWREIQPMAFARRRHNVVLLPDGNVLVVGGTKKSDSASEAVLAAELWNPATEQWSTVASMSEARMYHSAAALLPDGRVVAAGGEASGRLHAQVYSPPYLFKGPRPTIDSAPGSADYGASFDVATPEAASITAVRLLRPCAVTHAIDMNQRAVSLAFTVGSDNLTVTAPASPDQAPPGYYMLVIVDANGVPSVASWVRLGGNVAPGRVSGRVTDAAAGAGIANATVSYSGGSTTTDSTGSFEFAQVIPGEHAFSAAAPSFATSTRTLTVAPGGDFVLDFALAIPGAIQGQVTDAATAAGISEATVSVDGTSTLTAADGSFTITGLSAGTHQVSAAATGYYSTHHTVTVASGATTTDDFALQELDPRILGEVLDAGTQDPIAGATVAYSGGTTTTDALGRYVFSNVVPGTYDVTASASGYVSLTHQAVVTARSWTSKDFALISGSGTALRFLPEADAYVKSTSPTNNYGTQSTLQARAPSPEYRTFLKFKVENVGAIRSAKVRLFVTDDSNVGPGLYHVGNDWTETGINWTSAPALGGTPLIVAPSAPRLNWIELDVSGVVLANGTYSFGLSNTSTNSVLFSSREGANPPELIVQTPGDTTLFPRVSGFQPESGPVGTSVTISGARFSDATQVFFNGTAAVGFTVDSDSQIRADVPAGASTGPVSVGNTIGTSISALPFTVTTITPQVLSFAPASGAAGTQVDVRGVNFANASAVTFNGIGAGFTILSDTLLRALVPAGATTGRITVTNPYGPGTSATDFTVIVPPSVDSFTPTSGPVGTVVTVAGTGFLGTTAVAFNGMAATQFTVDSNIRIRATVPTGATTGWIRVTNGAGLSESGSAFAVTAPPVQLTLLPIHDAHGYSASAAANYGALTSLRVKNDASDYNSYLKFEVSGIGASVQSAKLRLYCTDESPDGGAIYLVSNDYQSTTTPWVESGLTWNNAPVIGGTPVAPSKAAGTNAWIEWDVTTAITGDGTYSFGVMSNSHNSAYYNSKEAATNRPVLVIDASPSSSPVIESFSPTDAAVGSIITIDGNNFVGVTGVTFNGAPADFHVQSATQIHAAVPASATTGKIAVTTADGTGQSATDFTVVWPPSIASFSPGGGPVGTVVTIDGNNFAGVSSVTFNGTVATSFTVSSNVQIQATVPSGATTGKIGVGNSAGSASSTNDFVLLNPPAVASFTPASGVEGAQVTITGSQFVGVTDVSFNGTPASAYTVAPNQIQALVPSGASSGPIAVSNGDGTGQSAANFTVILPPSIASFTPASGQIGTEVTIAGDNLAGVTTVSFNGTAATSFTITSNVQIQATVPSGAAGGRIEVHNAAGIAQSATDFVVTAPPPIISFAPVHDAHVTSGSATGNYGSLNTIRVRSTNSPFYNSYLKFEVSGVGQVQRATLRLYCTDDGPDGGAIYAVSNAYLSSATPWLESGLNWNNAPAIGGTPVAPSQMVGKNVWVEYDVTAAIAGGGTYSFGIKSNNSNSVYYNSKEAATNRPELVIESGSGAPAPPVISSFTPGSGPVGSEVTINGSSFVNVTGVTFNAIAASAYTVDSPTRIRATVPGGATTGRIGVATADGSTQSATDFVVGAPPPIVSFAPVHDAHVTSGSATGNYGSLNTIRVRSTNSPFYNSYLKFEVTGLSGPAQSAKLRLYCTDDGPDGGAIYVVSNDYLSSATPWLESGLNWNNAPAIGGTPVAPSQAVGKDVWVEYDVTPAITGAGTYSFGIKSNNSNSVYYSSKEGAHPPALVVTSGAPLAGPVDVPAGRNTEAPEDEQGAELAPARLTVRAYPNPSAGRLSFAYAAPRRGTLRLTVFDVRGRLVQSSSRWITQPGPGLLEWDGRDAGGHAVGSGIYLYRLELGTERRGGKLVLNR